MSEARLWGAEGHRRVSLPLEDRSLRAYPHLYRLLGGDVDTVLGDGWRSIGYEGPPALPPPEVTSFDFSRSTFTFRTDQAKKPSRTRSEPARFDLNNARIPVDCVADVTHVASASTQRFLLGGNCKTERQAPLPPQSIWTRVDDGLNADFVPIMGETAGMHVKTVRHMPQCDACLVANEKGTPVAVRSARQVHGAGG